MSSRPSSPEFSSYLSPRSRDKMSERRASRIASVSAHAKLIETADAEDRTLSPYEYIRSRCEALDSQMQEYQGYLEAMSGIDEQVFPGVQEDRKRCIDRLTPIVQEHKVLKRSERGLVDAMSDEIRIAKRRKAETNETDNMALGRAYSNSICQNFQAGARQRKSSFDQSKFRKAAVKFYDAEQNLDGGEIARCHLVGYCSKKDVKAAHIIPKSMLDDVVEHLFGSEERNWRASPRNCKFQICQAGSSLTDF